MNVRYFDNAATTRVKDEVLEEMLPYLKEKFGNPSSMYTIGREAKKAIENARERVAKLINCKANEIYFTGSGSESDNTAIKGIAHKRAFKGKHIITSKIEHPAVLHTCQSLEREGFKVTYLNVNKDGIVDINQLINSIRNDTILISIMYANNEIGTIQPIHDIAKIAKMHNIVFHTDAVQACGNIPINVQKMQIDMLSLSGHKLYAPKGTGALYVKNGIEFEKFIDGGHQEKNKRAGTENVSGIVGLGKACELANINLEEHQKYLTKLRDYYILQVQEKIPNVRLNGSKKERLPGNANFSFELVDGQSLLLNLDAKGICASSGSACSTGSSNPSHVLLAIGLSPELAYGALRTTFGEENTKEDTDSGLTPAQEEQLALYKAKIVRYLIVPEDAEIPAGLDKEMIVIQKPKKSAYVGSEEVLEILDKLNATDQITSVGVKQKNCKVEGIAKAIKAKKIIYAGTYKKPENKKLMKSKCDLAILSNKILPDEKNEKKMSVEDQQKRYEELAEKFVLLDVPMIVDRSADEEKDDAKAEWSKVYEAIFAQTDSTDSSAKN